MLDYVFFHPHYATRFIEFLNENGIEHQSREEGETVLVSVPEDLDEVVDEAIEARYEALMEAHEAIDEGEQMHRVGVQYQQADGETAQVRLDATAVNRLTGILSVAELQQLVQDIADEVESGGQQRLCQTD